METVRLNTITDYPRKFFVYDTQEKEFTGYKVLNDDYNNKQEVYLNFFTPVNREIVAWQRLEAYQLVDSYKKGELNEGKLKEIAATLDAEDNPVIMLIKHKK